MKVDEKNCFGMVEWRAMRDAASRFLPNHIETCLKTSKRGWRNNHGAEQGDVDGPLECSLALGMVAPKHEDAWLLSRPQAAFQGLVLKTFEKHSACKQITQSDCRKPPTSSWVAQTNSAEPTTVACVAKEWTPGGLVVRGRR